MTEHTIDSIAEIINRHGAVPLDGGGGGRCSTEECHWAYPDSPLPMIEVAKHQAEMIQAHYGEPAAAPSVEQIAEVLRNSAAGIREDAIDQIADYIHTLYDHREDAGEGDGWSGVPGTEDHPGRLASALRGCEAQNTALRERAEKAEARAAEFEEQAKDRQTLIDRVRELEAEVATAHSREDYERASNNGLRAEIERYKAALEAAGARDQARKAQERAGSDFEDARSAFTNATEDLRVAEKRYAAARAAVEAERCTGAGDCTVPVHVHGCYADVPPEKCDDPDDRAFEAETTSPWAPDGGNHPVVGGAS